MARIERMRTTAFRVEPDALDEVYGYYPDERFRRAWQLEAERRGQGNGRGRLPYRSLKVTLRGLAGSWVEIAPSSDPAVPFLLSTRPIDPDTLAMAFSAWEQLVLELSEPGVFSDRIASAEVRRLVVADHITHRSAACPHPRAPWVWSLVPWLAAERLIAEPLNVEGHAVPIRLTTDGELLTWDAPVSAERRGTALHAIRPRLITLPEVESLVIHLQSRLIRLSERWFRQAGAWVDPGPDQLLLAIPLNARSRERGWQHRCKEQSAALLKRVNPHPLPGPDTAPSFRGPLRIGFGKQPAWGQSLGKGVGNVFHDAVAWQAYKTLGEPFKPLELVLPNDWRTTHSKRDELARHWQGPVGLGGAGPERLRLVVVYADSASRQRALRSFLALVGPAMLGLVDEAALPNLEARLAALPDGEELEVKPLRLALDSPPDAAHYLCNRVAHEALNEWVENWLAAYATEKPTAMLLQTLDQQTRDQPPRAEEQDKVDPKPFLRRALARHDLVSQFIAADSVPSARSPQGQGSDEDHAALNAWLDLLRSAGWFARRFPARHVAHGTLLVGIHVRREWSVRRRGRYSRRAYALSIVAVAAGTSEAVAMDDHGHWRPVGEATAQYHAGAFANWREDALEGGIQAALEHLRAACPDRPMVLFFDGPGCRRALPFLANSGDGRVPGWLKELDASVVRVVAEEDELPQVAGQNGWASDPKPARYTRHRMLQVEGLDTPRTLYMVSGSRVMDRGQRARYATRFTTDERGLGEDWHSLKATEFFVMHDGPHDRHAVFRQCLDLCQAYPNWDGVLRRPAPLHLARALMEDHPKLRN